MNKGSHISLSLSSVSKPQEDAFKCNNSRCLQPLLQESFMTNCSHIFCASCAQKWFAKSKFCPVCQKAEVKVKKMNFSKREANWRLSLVGKNPSEILEASNMAFDFWVFQKNLEVSALYANSGVISSKNKEIETHYKKKFNSLQHQLEKTKKDQQLTNTRLNEILDEKEMMAQTLKQQELSISELSSKYQTLKKAYYKIKGNKRDRSPHYPQNNPNEEFHEMIDDFNNSSFNKNFHNPCMNMSQNFQLDAFENIEAYKNKTCFSANVGGGRPFNNEGFVTPNNNVFVKKNTPSNYMNFPQQKHPSYHSNRKYAMN